MNVTITNPTNEHRPRPGIRQGPAPTTIKMRAGSSLRIYTASFTRAGWMATERENGRTQQGWIAELPADAAEALRAAA